MNGGLFYPIFPHNVGIICNLISWIVKETNFVITIDPLIIWTWYTPNFIVTGNLFLCNNACGYYIRKKKDTWLTDTNIEKNQSDCKLQHHTFLTRGHLCETNEWFKSNNTSKIGYQMQQRMNWPMAGQRKMW